jgi:hypothetical protein
LTMWTVLVIETTQDNTDKVLWIEGESDGRACRVRDYEIMLSNPTAMDDQVKEKSSKAIQDDSWATRSLATLSHLLVF